MRTTIMLSILIIALFASCTKEEVRQDACLDQVLEVYDMVRYDGRDIECEFFLTEYLLNNQRVFVLGSHCADVIVVPVDCGGQDLCEEWEESVCLEFPLNATRIGFVGISE